MQKIIIQEKEEKKQVPKENLRNRAICDYYRISGGKCVNCKFCRTKQCPYPHINQTFIAEAR